MTKVERETLHALKCIVETNRVNMGDGPETLYVVNFSLTEKQLTTMMESLARNSTPDGDALMAYLKMAAQRIGILL